MSLPAFRHHAVGLIFLKKQQRMSLANLFQRPHYRSDATEFIDALKAAHPNLDAQQREGRALLWDKQIDSDLQAQFRAGRVAQNPYVYQSAPAPD
jgi:hypothetical protein